MKLLIEKYSGKLVRQGLCPSGGPLLCGLDASREWNRDDECRDVLNETIDMLNISSILFSPSSEPYCTIIGLLGEEAVINGTLYPEDSETRTFLHDIPVLESFTAGSIAGALRRRKGAVIPGRGIVTSGTVSPEQAFVSYSSICFSLFVKFFADLAMSNKTEQNISEKMAFAFSVINDYRNFISTGRNIIGTTGPFTGAEKIVAAMVEAGSATVTYRLVDSYFGNISYRDGNTVYISQTGSSLDELAGCIDPCPMDSSSCAGITASSELSAHMEIYNHKDHRAILHGHPKFSVIMSMICDKKNTCTNAGRCHRQCPERRFIRDIPVVPGEVGTGPYGLCKTMPPAISENRGVIVYGHGLFTTGCTDFTDAFRNLLDIELLCLKEYEDRLKGRPG